MGDGVGTDAGGADVGAGAGVAIGAGGADVGTDAGAAIGAGGTDAGTDAGAIGVETDTDPDCPWVGVYLAIRVAAFPGRATPATTRGPLLAKPKERAAVDGAGAGAGAGVAEMGAGAGADVDVDPDADAGTNAGTVLVAELSGIGVGT